MTDTRYILTLSCKDARGIVASVSGFLSEQKCFIIESGQYGDDSTSRFFMRVDFSTEPGAPDEAGLNKAFEAKVGKPFAMDWQITPKGKKSRIFIMVSKAGHCLNDLLYRHEAGQLAVEICGVGANHRDLEKAVLRHGIPFHYLPVEPSKDAQEKKLMALLEQQKIDVVVLARYMQILSPALCKALSGRAINIHHSFLPSFKGAKPYHQAFDRGVKIIGATAHYVTTDLDEGPIIEQEVSRVDHTNTPADLAAIGHDIECLVLARALKYHTEHRVLLNGKKTVVFR